MRVLLDTNIVVRHAIAAEPRHGEVRAAVERLRTAGDRPLIANQSLFEFWVVATRPRDVNRLGMLPDEAYTRVHGILGAFGRLPDPKDLLERRLDLCTRYSVRGRPAHDARLVAVMLAHGVTDILTLNPDDFARYPEVKCLAPADA